MVPAYGGAAHNRLPGEPRWLVETPQEVRTLMTVTVTGVARVQEFVLVSTSVASG